ncbi:MAG: FAD-dependent oxidoreductase [Patescibacteria group bacterium]
MYDLVIIGGGPAGVAAGIYAARKKIKTVLVTDFFGGQSLVSNDVENWIGVKNASGLELAKMMEEHLRAQEDIEIMDGTLVSKIEKIADKKNQSFKVSVENGKVLEAKTILISLGSRRKKLNILGERELEGKGVSYCATCDAPLFKNKVVAVAGGGNSGLEAVTDLIPYASKIYLIHRSDALKGDPITQDKIRSNPKVEIILNAQMQEVFGETSVSGLKYKDKSGEIKEIKCEGVFVEIGSMPNNDLVKNIVKLNDWGEIVVDHKTQQTSEPGIWAAGDVTDVSYKQNNISMGDAVKAALNIHDYLKRTS